MPEPRFSSTVIIVDDEASIRQSLGNALEDEGFRVRAVGDGEKALEAIRDDDLDLVLLDIWLPGRDGIEVLEQIKKERPDLPVIMISGHGTVETAVRSTKLGAFDFIEKPLSLDKVILTINHAIELSRITREYKRLHREVMGEDELIGSSPLIHSLREQMDKVAPTEGWVLITGENGTGKEVVARTIHRESLRKDRPFVPVNCAAIPEELIESELFGYEKGAFTGAEARKPGKFDLADQGTIFLDEIADMSLKTQAKVLRILQEHQFERVGGTSPIQVDVRVIAATNQDLEAAIKQGRFREDLYYRLNVIPLNVPPLRERIEDIPLFVQHFVKVFSEKSRLKPKKVKKKAMNALMRYPWPGNVRELKNIIERMVILSTGKEIEFSDLPPAISLSGIKLDEAPDEKVNLRKARKAFEKEYISKRLIANQYNISRTARELGLDRASLYRKMKAYGIEIAK
jgi:two-component system nitrogen regulation response regulator NtrX